MSGPGELERFVGKVSMTLELTCFDYESTEVTELLQIQPTWTTPMQVAASPQDPAPWEHACAWHYGTGLRISSAKVSDHVQHLLSLFLPIKSRIEEMRFPPRINLCLEWECSPFGVSGLTGPQFNPEDIRGMAELGAALQVKVIQRDEIKEN